MKTLTQSGHPFIRDPQRRFAPIDCPVSPDRCPTWIGIGVRFHRNTHQAAAWRVSSSLIMPTNFKKSEGFT